jgi:hypothetical protein
MNRIAKWMQLAIAFLLAVTFFNPAVSAQTVAGKISLPYQVEWLGSIIPAGQYTFSIPDSTLHPFVVLRNSEDRRGIVLMFEPGASYDYSSPASVLDIVIIDGRRYVKSLGLAPLQRRLVFRTPEHKLHESPHNIVSAQSIGVQ